MQSIVKVSHLQFAYEKNNVLEDLTFEIEEGDYVGLIGPNGGGKTTLLKLILGLEKGRGEISLFNIPLKSFKDWGKIGYLAQKSPIAQSLFPITTEEVVAMGLAQNNFNHIKHEDLKKIYFSMEQTNTLAYKGKLFHDLSIGQQQRILLARSLVSRPQLLILDEPSTALDASSREMFFNLLGKLNEEQHTTIVLITHDTGEVGQHISKFMYVDKKLIFFGSKEEFCHSSTVATQLGPFAQHTIDHLHNYGKCPLGHHCER